MDSIKVGIVGVSGYGGGELARLIAAHPQAELTYVTSGTYEGKPLSAALPGIDRRVNLICEGFNRAPIVERCDVVFLAGEAGHAMRVAPMLLELGKKVVDLSADFRLKDPAVYKEWYKADHVAPQLLNEAVYGLPELNRKAIKTARLVANPGCHVTAAVLGLAPLVKAVKVLAGHDFIIDSLSGVSGAGRSKFGLDYHFAELNESMRPYGVGGVHRHTPEIEEALAMGISKPIITFTPHLVPITRGILTTSYANLASRWQEAENAAELLHSVYQGMYRDEPFVTVLEPGQFPATKHTNGTNMCHIGLAVDKRTNRVIVVSALDNLVKGAAGQAVQNMNLMCGLDETAGLTMSAVWP